MHQRYNWELYSCRKTSISLIPAETRYANIECEMLAVVFGCTKFHHYLYDREFIWHTDHKPLEDIHMNHLSDAPPVTL